MSSTMKLILGAVLGYAGYMAYKKLQRTQTVMVDTFDNPIPEIVGSGGYVFPQYMMIDQIAGLRGMGDCAPCRGGR